MPYYCTVPRCTSMAGKAKNVSFHQFPRDQELAKLWNNILKRGKPYTKYSKVCSLHFKPEDYTITSAGKNKGQWRTLRKDAIPSQNLPSDTPAPYQRRQSSGWFSSGNMQTNLPAIDPQIQQQLAQAIYMQTMLAMQAAGVTDPLNFSAICNGLAPALPSEDTDPHTSNPQEFSSSDHESEAHENDAHQNDRYETHVNGEHERDSHRKDVRDINDKIDRSVYENDDSVHQNDEYVHESDDSVDKNNGSVHRSGDSVHRNDHIHESDNSVHRNDDSVHVNDQRRVPNHPINIAATSFKCDDCSKCFKDPDVFILHKRTHKTDRNGIQAGKENFNLNTIKPEMLKSNPILANLLKSTVEKNIFNSNLFEKQLLVSFSSMENYLRGVSRNDFNDCDTTSDNLDDNDLVIDDNVV